MSQEYDFVIVGAGLSGVMLARRLLQEPSSAPGPGGPRILLVGPSLAHQGRTTFAFWARGATALDEWELARWRWLRLIGHDDRVRNLALEDWTYRAVSWDAARTALLSLLARDTRITLIEATVDEVRPGTDRAHVHFDGQWASGRFVFDSRPRQDADASLSGDAPRRGLTLYQSFHGIWVNSDDIAVDDTAATLLDFSADDGPDLGFAYVLPIDRRTAMVMAVRMAATPDLPDPAPAVPRELGRDSWNVIGEERGVTALTTPPAPRRQGPRVLAIGARGGCVRASTGYAVTRILADTDAIVASLRRAGHPFAIPADPTRDRLLDAIWLHALATQRADLEQAFLALFAGVPIGSVLRFLDGRSSAIDLLRVVGALPPGPFLRAAGRLAIGIPAASTDTTSGTPTAPVPVGPSAGRAGSRAPRAALAGAGRPTRRGSDTPSRPGYFPMVEHVAADGLTIAYQRVGEGDPLVLVHGAGDDSRIWQPQLIDLADEFTVVAWDEPGAGRSSDLPEGFTLGGFADGLAALIESLGMGPAHVAGLSWGGTVVLELYRRHPALVATLIMIDTYAGWKGSLPADEVQARVAGARRMLAAPSAESDPTPGLFAGDPPEDFVPLLAAMATDVRPGTLAQELAIMAQADLSDLLPHVGVPTLLLWGDSDPRSPLAVARQFEEAIPDAELVVIEGAGHISNLERPEQVNAAVRAFCRAHPPRAN